MDTKFSEWLRQLENKVEIQVEKEFKKQSLTNKHAKDFEIETNKKPFDSSRQKLYNFDVIKQTLYGGDTNSSISLLEEKEQQLRKKLTQYTNPQSKPIVPQLVEEESLSSAARPRKRSKEVHSGQITPRSKEKEEIPQSETDYTEEESKLQNAKLKLEMEQQKIVAQKKQLEFQKKQREVQMEKERIKQELEQLKEKQKQEEIEKRRLFEEKERQKKEQEGENFY
jgi:hypothetical protein